MNTHDYDPHEVLWIVDQVLLDRHDDCGSDRIDRAIVCGGHICHINKTKPFLEVHPDFGEYPNNHPVVIYGTTRFIRQVEEATLFIPGAFCKWDNLKYSTCAAHYGEWMLNDRFIMLPYVEFKRRILEDLVLGLSPPHFKSHKLFMRPDSVGKQFAGRVFDFDEPEDNVVHLTNYTHIHDEEIVIVAPDMSDYILSESRYVIADHEVIAQSQYRRDGVTDIRGDVDNEARVLAKYISMEEWQPDYVYVVDVAMTPDGARIIECNAFSCSGLYACDTTAIAKIVSFVAWKEFHGLLDT